MEIHYVILVIHLIVGLALVYLAMKAFKKTKYPAGNVGHLGMVSKIVQFGVIIALFGL